MAFGGQAGGRQREPGQGAEAVAEVERSPPLALCPVCPAAWDQALGRPQPEADRSTQPALHGAPVLREGADGEGCAWGRGGGGWGGVEGQEVWRWQLQ